MFTLGEVPGDNIDTKETGHARSSLIEFRLGC